MIRFGITRPDGSTAVFFSGKPILFGTRGEAASWLRAGETVCEIEVEDTAPMAITENTQAGSYEPPEQVSWIDRLRRYEP